MTWQRGHPRPSLCTAAPTSRPPASQQHGSVMTWQCVPASSALCSGWSPSPSPPAIPKPARSTRTHPSLPLCCAQPRPAHAATRRRGSADHAASELRPEWLPHVFARTHGYPSSPAMRKRAHPSPALCIAQPTWRAHASHLHCSAMMWHRTPAQYVHVTSASARVVAAPVRAQAWVSQSGAISAHCTHDARPPGPVTPTRQLPTHGQGTSLSADTHIQMCIPVPAAATPMRLYLKSRARLVLLSSFL